MRVGIYAEDLDPQEGGGFSLLEELLDALLRTKSPRHEWVLFGGGSAAIGALARECGIDRVPTASEGRRKRTRFLRQAFPGVAAAASAVGYHDSLTRSAVAARVDIMWFLGRALVAVDLPYICTILDVAHREQPWWPEVSSGGRWLFRDRLYYEAVTRAALVIVPNEAGRLQLVRAYGLPESRTLALPHPAPRFAAAEPGRDASEALARVGITREFVFYPAQFWPHKNHVAILRALRILENSGALVLDAVFCGSDKGNLAHVRAAALQLGVASRVHFPGFVDRETLAALYRNALALTYASYLGPENLPPLEACALECPVLAADVDGARLQLGDAALYVDPSSAQGWADAIALVRDPKVREPLVAAGKRRARIGSAEDYVQAMLQWLDRFSAVRECWPHSVSR